MIVCSVDRHGVPRGAALPDSSAVAVNRAQGHPADKSTQGLSGLLVPQLTPDNSGAALALVIHRADEDCARGAVHEGYCITITKGST